MHSKDLLENYTALLIAIEKEVCQEEAFKILDIVADGKQISNRKFKVKLINEDMKDMIKLKNEGLTYKQIGEIYGISDHAVYRRIKRYKEKCS